MALVPSFIPGGDSINSTVSSFLDSGEVGIETVRRIDYAAQYLWTIDFNPGDNVFKPPAPFNDFFPASDITFPSAVSNNHTFEMGQSGFSIPRNTSARSIDITFYDDEKLSLHKWMNDWIKLDIYNNGHFVSGINDNHSLVDRNGIPTTGSQDSFGNVRNAKPKRHIRIAFLDKSKSEVLVYNYDIVPNGEIVILGSNNSEATTFIMKFDIVGVNGVKEAKPAGDSLFKTIQKTLTRFI